MKILNVILGCPLLKNWSEKRDKRVITSNEYNTRTNRMTVWLKLQLIFLKTIFRGKKKRSFETVEKLPFEEENEGGNRSGSKNMSINDEDVMTHPSTKRDFGNDVHASISKLQRYHSKIGFRILKKTIAAVEKAKLSHWIFLGKYMKKNLKWFSRKVERERGERWKVVCVIFFLP